MNQKINESALLGRGEQAQAQLEQIRNVLAQRGSAAVGTWLDGLGSLVVNARAGDLQSRAVLRTLKELLDQVELIGAIALPGD
jgi:hypothetical protein